MYIYWITKAAKQGVVDAQYNLALSYHLTKNYQQAAYWWKRAAQQGDGMSQFNLSKYYIFGIGVLQNNKKAFAWLSNAIAQNITKVNNINLLAIRTTLEEIMLQEDPTGNELNKAKSLAKKYYLEYTEHAHQNQTHSKVAPE